MTEETLSRTRSRFRKKLVDLEPPSLKLSNPFDQFTAGLHVLNSFLWSTEISFATTLSDYAGYEDSVERSTAILAHTDAGAFKPRVGQPKPHYTARMGSLLVQLRWNYDALGRYVLIEAMSIFEKFCVDRTNGLIRKTQADRSPNILKNALEKKGVILDPLKTYRIWIYKEIRNDLIHSRSTIHSFPTPELLVRTGKARNIALKWESKSGWEEKLRKAFNEALWSTKELAEQNDLPHMFFIAIYSLTRIGKFGDHLNSRLAHAGL